MKESISWVSSIVWCLFLVCVCISWQPMLGFGATDSAGQANHLLSLGQIGPKAIGLKVWTEKPVVGTVNSDEAVDVWLTTEAEGYVVAIHVSGGGEAIILYPNGEISDSRVVPGKEYMLLGPDSKLRPWVNEKNGPGKIAFYVSSTPFQLAPLQPREGEACVRILGSSAKEMETLTQKLEAMSQAEGFNRVVLELKTPTGKNMSLGLMGLPTEAKSSKPQPVTGVQGLRDKILESDKE